MFVMCGWPLATFAQTDGEPQLRTEILRRQREAKQEDLEPYVVSPAEARVLQLEQWNFPRNIFVRGWNRFRPLIGGMPSGSGFVAGAGFVNGLDREDVDIQVNARVSTRGFSTFDAMTTFPTDRRETPLHAFARAEARNLTELRIYGLGPDSPPENRTTYELQDRTLEAGLRLELGRFVELAGRGGFLRAEVRGGTGTPTLFDIMTPQPVPGLGGTTDYVVAGGDATIDLRDDGFPPAGVVLSASAYRYEDVSTDRFDFDRVVGEIRAYAPLGYRNRRLALRVRSSHSTGRNGGAIPFYLMEAIGGGSTLRGYREYRFRDTRNLLVNAEYRWEVWTYVDFALFYDAGKVFDTASQLNFEDLESSGGFGMRVHTPTGFVFRMDLARSDEGLRFHIGSGPSF